MNRPIECCLNLERLFLKLFTDEAVTDCSSRLFHKLTTFSEKKYSLRSSLHLFFRSFSACPLVRPLFSNSNRSSNDTADRRWTTLYTSIRSARTRFFPMSTSLTFPIFQHMASLSFLVSYGWTFSEHAPIILYPWRCEDSKPPCSTQDEDVQLTCINATWYQCYFYSGKILFQF